MVSAIPGVTRSLWLWMESRLQDAGLGTEKKKPSAVPCNGWRVGWWPWRIQQVLRDQTWDESKKSEVIPDLYPSDS